ncbi:MULTISPECIES: helix-turn-helix domain-containing protein [Tsukamurella]|uniref:Helix-turn-helix domain-containing protein n=2 Tax=Tsukamurella TaxID=2060 RepID=A0A5C5RYQ1_9ACTN|nr:MULTISPECIES: helix-turn-helix transcriptional regulator [Tsukamurella]NMD54262.1 helix-turn-helix domain-containing protein [Tsukamurella columbiensis]TWS28219.1 helix-turn-helix domain-containing protein [Tsukamurella conjunctivitidis]
MARDQRLVTLGAFVRARRDAANPPATDERRQVSGLRREEVAAQAFISDDYYRRIEQGRIVPSADVLRRIGEVLGFGDDETRYAESLLSEADHPERPVAGAPSAALRSLVDQLGEVPALVIGPGTAILAWNDAAAELLVDFAAIPAARRRYVELLFTDDDFQSRFADLDAMRRTVVGIVRASAPSGQPDSAWIDDLERADERFRELWRRHAVTQPHDHLRVRLRTEDGASTEYDQVVLQVVDEPTQRVLLFARRSP